MPSFTFSFIPSQTTFLLYSVCLVFFCSPVAAFGAGNIASLARIEGLNWRHGDIEDTLLNILLSRAAGGKKFSKLDVKRVYFGNWLRDYSQAVDVGTVKYVSAEAIRILLWVLGFMSFGYGTKEFEVTTERLGCYRPEEHIDNPKDYADNEDARQYDRRLRGPVDERRELAVNPQTGLKNYIASEGMGITTSAGLVRNLFGRCIQLGRQYARTGNKADLYEAFRLLGTGCHCLEDYSAHSNYTELALIELGEQGVFPHVGSRTKIQLPGARQSVYPIITGTFGGVDFLHSVMGEFSDKATQSEMQELQGTLEQSQGAGQNVSILQDLLSSVPSGLFGGKDQAGKADELQMNAQAAHLQNTHITPRQPEAWINQLQQVQQQIYPILEWHDEIMQSITETIDKIPILPDLIEQIQDEINTFVFSLLAPFVVPIINQVKTELATGSSEIIQSSRNKQLIVFHDDRSSDPTHSMLSKDHFSNILNEPAGKVASQVLQWVVPQLIACWDDERIEVNRTLTRIINGVFHHPALRNYGDDGARDGRQLMFGVLQQWWGEKDERERQIMRDQLSRDGVEQGRNHKEGVQDSGHGCGKPLGMPTAKTAGSSGAPGGGAAGSVLENISAAFVGQSQYDTGFSSGGEHSAGGIGKVAGEALGGGALGGLVGGLVGASGDLLEGAFEGSGSQKQGFKKQQYGEDGSYTQSFAETGYSQPSQNQPQRYGQAEYSQTSFPGGGQRQEYQRFQQEDPYGRSGYGEQTIQESRPTYGGGYEQTTEGRYERPGGTWESSVHRQGHDASGEPFVRSEHHEGHGGYKKDSDSDDSCKKKKRHEKKHKKHGSRDNSGSENEYGGRSGEYISQRKHEQPHQTYGEEHRYGDERRHTESREEYGQERGNQAYGSGNRHDEEFRTRPYAASGYQAANRYGETPGDFPGEFGSNSIQGQQRPDETFGSEPLVGFGRREGLARPAGFERREGFGRQEESSREEQFGRQEQFSRQEEFGGQERLGGPEGFTRQGGFGRGEEYGGGEEGFGGEQRNEGYGDRGYGQGNEYQERREYDDGY